MSLAGEVNPHWLTVSQLTGEPVYNWALSATAVCDVLMTTCIFVTVPSEDDRRALWLGRRGDRTELEPSTDTDFDTAVAQCNGDWDGPCGAFAS